MKRESVNYNDIPRDNILGKDVNSYGLLKILLKERNTIVNLKRYKNLMNTFGNEKNFLDALYKKYKIRCELRFVYPEKLKITTSSIETVSIMGMGESKKNAEHGYYVLEEVIRC